MFFSPLFRIRIVIFSSYYCCFLLFLLLFDCCCLTWIFPMLFWLIFVSIVCLLGCICVYGSKHWSIICINLTEAYIVPTHYLAHRETLKRDNEREGDKLKSRLFGLVPNMNPTGVRHTLIYQYIVHIYTIEYEFIINTALVGLNALTDPSRLGRC